MDGVYFFILYRYLIDFDKLSVTSVIDPRKSYFVIVLSVF